MSGPTRATQRRTLTPAVLGASGFMVVAALASVAFVTARGGLELPLAPTIPPFAVVSPPPPTPAIPSPGPSAEATSSPGPTASPSPGVEPTVEPSPEPPTPPPSGPPDPLAGLPPCPDHPGCYLYTVRRNDSYSAISDRYAVGLWIMDALNPEVADKRLIVVGQILYLGHDPTARLDLCADGTCHRYVVRSGDTLSTIAGRYGLSVAGIVAINPNLDPARIVTGQVIRLPLYRP